MWRNGGRSGKHGRIRHWRDQALVGAGNAGPVGDYTAATAKHRKISAGAGNRSGENLQTKKLFFNFGNIRENKAGTFALQGEQFPHPL